MGTETDQPDLANRFAPSSPENQQDHSQDHPQDVNAEAGQTTSSKGTPSPPPTNDACQDAGSGTPVTCQRQLTSADEAGTQPSADDAGTQPVGAELEVGAVSEDGGSSHSPGKYPFLFSESYSSLYFSISPRRHRCSIIW
jgi:hypothetical protein